MSGTSDPQAQENAQTQQQQQKTEFSMSGGLVSRLASLGASVAFTSYQSGILYMLGRTPKGAHVHQSHFPKPMGFSTKWPFGSHLYNTIHNHFWE